MDLPRDFSDLLAEFVLAKAEVVLVGGYAVAFHARPRVTKDIDLLLRSTAENLEQSALALARFGAPRNVVEAVRHMGALDIVYMGQAPLRIDMMCRIDGVDTDSIFERSVETRWGDVPVRIIAIDDLIVNKLAAARPQDLLDVSLLEQTRLRKSTIPDRL